MKVEEAEVVARTFDPTKLTSKDRKRLVSYIIKHRDYYSGVVAFIIYKNA